MIEAHLALIPGNNDVILWVDYKAFNPDAHLFEGHLVIELDVDVSPILIYLGCENWGVFSLVVEIE